MEGRFELAVAVDDVLAMLDELDAERVALVGLRLGGSIARRARRTVRWLGSYADLA
jgi:pimeloyl-ACP methyl ester carboxylesterase